MNVINTRMVLVVIRRLRLIVDWVILILILRVQMIVIDFDETPIGLGNHVTGS